MNNIRLKVRATNLAREGVEMMFNIRDTNRRRYSGEKDKWRLFRHIKEDQNDNFTPGIFVLDEFVLDESNTGSDYSFYAKKVDNQIAETDDFYSDDGFWKDIYNNTREDTRISFDDFGDYEYRLFSGNSFIQQTGNVQDIIGSDVEFYRIVRVYGVFCKNSENPNETRCIENSDPKEMRFCVKVFYTNGVTRGSSELCSVMTNFME